jgi:hypothetical protein
MEIKLNLLKIIESLTPTEPQTGSELKAYLEKRSDVPIAVEIDRPTTAAELVASLTELADRTEARACSPILHLEMHGYKKGVQTTSLEILSWDELGLLVRRINIAMRNSLVVTTAVCEGAYFAIAAAIHPSWPAPFCGVVGPDKKVKSKLMLDGFSGFYAALLTKGDFQTALHELQQRNLPEYRALDMADLFRAGSEAYAQLVRGDILEERIANIIAHADENEIERRGGREAVVAEIRANLTNYQPRLEERWRKFIMADIYPENAARFAPLKRGA